MKNSVVKDLMVPITEYATVPEGANLFEAVSALEKAQEEFDYEHTPYHHRAMLVMDKDQRVVGKLSQFDVLRALEQKGEEVDHIEDIRQFGFSTQLVAKLRENKLMKETTLKDICGLAAKKKVADFMQATLEGEYIDENAPLETAIYQLTMQSLLSLLVTRGKEIVGILRMSDVFAAVFHIMKECEQTG